MTMAWNAIPGETPIDISGLKISGINNRQDLSVVEAENVRKAIVKYLGLHQNLWVKRVGKWIF